MERSNDYLKYRTLCVLSEDDLKNIQAELDNEKKTLEDKKREELQKEKERLENEWRKINQQLESIDSSVKDEAKSDSQKKVTSESNKKEKYGFLKWVSVLVLVGIVFVVSILVAPKNEDEDNDYSQGNNRPTATNTPTPTMEIVEENYDFDGAEIKVFGSVWSRVNDEDYAEAIEKVEEKYNVQFTYAELKSNYSTLAEEIIASVYRKEPSVDIISLDSGNLFSCIASGVLYDMTDDVDSLGVNPIHTEAGTWQGRCYGVSYDHLGDSWVLIYDREYLKEIGMEKTPTDMFMEGNWSYDDFEAYCAELKGKLPEGVYPIGQYPYHWGVMAAGANGTAICDTDGKLGLMDEAYIEALEFYVEMENKGLAYPMKQEIDENGYTSLDIAYDVSDERIIMRRAEAWQLSGLSENFGIVYWPWGSDVTCTGNYTTLSDNYKVTTPFWGVDVVINDSCDKLGIPGNVMMQIIYDFRNACGGTQHMHEEYAGREGLFGTTQDAELYKWGASRVQFDMSWTVSDADIFSPWKQTADVLLRYYDARTTSESYYNQARAAFADIGITIP